MGLKEKIMPALKEAMKAKDSVALESLRAIKSGILLLETQGNDKGVTEQDEIKLLQKLVKQRNDSAAIYKEQGREDLAQPELDQAKVISEFLPKQLSEEELKTEIEQIIAQTGAASMKDMGKVMGMASSKLGGSADGKAISTMVKKLLT